MSAPVPRPLCFVLMPFGTRPDENNRLVDFDTIYEEVIRPAVEGAGMECLRADEEKLGGIIHKPMFERLFLCDFAVADLTTANANVYYELGIRHALRPYTTVLMVARGSRLPFDLGPVRVHCHYELDDTGRPAGPAADSAALCGALSDAANLADSPVYQLLTTLKPPEPDRTGVEAFREQLAASAALRRRLRGAQDSGQDALAAFQEELGDLKRVAPTMARDLLLAYSAVEAWERMIELYQNLPPEVARLPQLREQFGLALNRNGRDDDAVAVLQELVDELGPTGETCGILGRVHKDRWRRALRDGHDGPARVHLKKAIESYVRGFEADWRNYYPGLNAVELMTLRNPEDPELARLLPVVRYSAERAAASGQHGYWESATLAELAVLADDEQAAQDWLDEALAARPTTMQTRTTRDSLVAILEAKRKVGTDVGWLESLVEQLAVPDPTA